VLTIALALLIAGQGVVAPTLSSQIAARSPERRRGEVLGIQQSAGGLARTVGPALGGYLFGRSIPAPYLVGAVLVTVAMLLVTDR
jgi:MFS family permease